MIITLTIDENLDEPVWSADRYVCSSYLPFFTTCGNELEPLINAAKGIALSIVSSYTKVPDKIEFKIIMPKEKRLKDILQ